MIYSRVMGTKKIGLMPYPRLCRPCRAELCTVISSDTRTPLTPGSWGTPWHVLDKAGCGWCTEIGAEPTARALRKFLACSDDELEQMGRNGRKLVEDGYTSVAVAKQFVDLYVTVR